MLSSLFSLLVAGVLLLSVTAQPYSPLVSPSNTAASCSGTTFVKIGNDNAAQFTKMTMYSAEVYFSAYNSTAFGAVITQLSLALGDNSALSSPTLLRMGLYQISTSPASATLVAQTPEITLYPSGPQMLYANLLAPAVLLSGGLYAIGVYAGSTYYVMGNGRNSSFYGYSSSYNYIDFSMPTSTAYLYASTSYQFGGAAYGCLNPSSIVPPNSQLFSFCAYVESYQPSPSTTDYTQVSTTTLATLTGTLTATLTSTSSSFGSGFAITAGSGSISISRSGADSYYEPYFTTTTGAFALTSANKITGIAPSNLVYPAGAAAMVDTNGLSFLIGSGVQYTIQWNAAINQYQILNSSTGGTTPAATVYSSFALSPITATAQTVAQCGDPPQIYTPPSVPSCPSGTLPIAFGDITTDLTDIYNLQSNYAYVAGNTLYFRPFYNQVANTIIQSLSTWLLPNPKLLVHLRMGLYKLSGAITSPTWILLSQAAEQVIVNPVNASVTVPLPSQVTLSTVGIYAIGIWYDQPVYSYQTYWETTPSPYNLHQAYTSIASDGTMPATANPTLDYALAASGANGCIPNVAPGSTIQFSFCASFKTASSTDTISGVLTALPTKSTGTLGSYWTLISGYATDSYNSAYGLTLGAITNPTPMRLYDNTTSTGGVAVDSTGLQFFSNLYNDEAYLYTIQSMQIPNTPAYTYQEKVQYYYQAATVNSIACAFSYQPYTAGATIPACKYLPITYANVVSPPSPAAETCVSMVGTLKQQFGDSNIADYSNQKEGNGIAALTVATNTFTSAVAVTVTQLAVDILANTASNFTIQLGLYSQAGALLGSTGVIALSQAYDQQIIGALQTPVLLPAGSYYMAVVANAPLFIATSTSNSPSMTVSTFGVPSTLTTSGSGAGVPLMAYGCSAATHTFCSQIQYNVPLSAGGPTSTTYQYQGIVAAVANSDSSYTITVADVHAIVFQRVATVPTTTISSFTELFLSGTNNKIYPSAAQPIDATGLTFTSPTLQLTVGLSYQASKGQYVDTWGTSLIGLTPIVSVFNLSTVSTTGTIIPSCNLVTLPSSVTPTPPAAPTCPSGQSLVTLGDDVSADYSSNVEEYNYQDNAYASLRPIPNTNQSVAVTQVALGLNNNVNSVANIAFAIYDGSYNLLAQSAVITVTNTPDAIIVGQLNTTVIIPPNSQYFAAVWSDNSLYLSFTFSIISYCAQMPPGKMFPSPFPSNQGTCGVVDLAAIGCSTPTTNNQGTQPNTPNNSGGSSSNNADLSKGAVAGIVIGCVVGTNLLLLICLFLACGLRKNGGVDKSHRNQSYEPNSRVELQTAEPSRGNAEAVA